MSPVPIVRLLPLQMDVSNMSHEWPSFYVKLITPAYSDDLVFAVRLLSSSDLEDIADWPLDNPGGCMSRAEVISKINDAASFGGFTFAVMA